MRTDTGDFESESRCDERDGAGFNGENALIETVEGRVEFTSRSAREVQDKVQLRIPGCNCAGVGTLEGNGMLRGLPWQR
jgi:hypothetical protein